MGKNLKVKKSAYCRPLEVKDSLTQRVSELGRGMGERLEERGTRVWLYTPVSCSDSFFKAVYVFLNVY